MRHIPVALRALAHQQQIALAHHASEVGDDRGIAAATTPDIGQKELPDISGNGLPQLGRRLCEVRDRFHGHGEIIEQIPASSPVLARPAHQPQALPEVRVISAQLAGIPHPAACTPAKTQR